MLERPAQVLGEDGLNADYTGIQGNHALCLVRALRVSRRSQVNGNGRDWLRRLCDWTELL